MDLRDSFVSDYLSAEDIELLNDSYEEEQFLTEIGMLLILRKHQKRNKLKCEREIVTNQNGDSKLRYVIELGKGD
ncbi:hypothetical protein P7D85_18815 [Enterococcus hulanensis]|uniref:ISLre2 family transposase n=1 Tax=Enterococcus hulanensis TaxID=2559929 RepID=A0ABU3F3Z6_9ENTE|nr:hypothetical protein [Enterococcus hulanensis]MDT2601837.1 hypothetical protein [Enterococcus hulanensis]MDT2611222.1 hypothetical protein [Enterococcus hulanensis]MDT2618492.1 hypothetical protein [Enterococcus hulanensis]MDT2629637.1 hypothetical protein [Enterococcus hulanensis]MDT2657369.1 hypothetical protein [Enterococcus hulanensis]